MRITPMDIRQQQFTVRMFRGFDVQEVDTFLEDVAQDYEALIKENALLKEQLQVLEETPTTRYLVLPPKPTVESGEALSDTDLAQVAAAGGRLQSFNYTTPYAGCCDTATN